MRELPIIDDKRLLGALDYIDERFIAEVTEEYEIFDTAPGAKLPPRARMYRFRQFAALAACLLLLSFASLGVNHVTNAVISFVASAGGSLNEYGSKYERAIDAYPADMPVEDIYEDVLKGGWIIVCNGELQNTASLDMWFEFLKRVGAGENACVLIAYYSNICEQNVYIESLDTDVIISPVINNSLKPTTRVDGATIWLTSVEYNGKNFTYSKMGYNPAYGHSSLEYKYLNQEELPRGGTVYYLANSSGTEPQLISRMYTWYDFYSDSVLLVPPEFMEDE